MSSSSEISSDKLKVISDNFITIENLKQANESLVNETKKLEIFEHYNVGESEKIFSAVDGQKFHVGVDTINARHSSKYFGKERGMTAMTMSANY